MVYNFWNLKKRICSGRAISWVAPDDHKLSNLILDCQDDPEAFFIPVNGQESRLTSLNPTKPIELEFLKNTLHAAFTTGKKIVVVRFTNGFHTVAAGFSSNGNFKIIDSMMYRTVNIKALTQVLNQASIKNDTGEIIQFKGEYINTRLQRGGHECIRFATLYCYQMYQKKNLEAFAEVNGAFLEGKLQRFEDYTKVEGSQKIPILNSEKADYASFMRSWAYRTRGIKFDTWEEMPITTIQHPLPMPYEPDGVMKTYCLQKDPHLPPYFICAYSALIIANNHKECSATSFATMPKEQEIVIEDINGTLGSLTQSGEKRLLVFENNNPTPRLYRLLPDQKLYTVDWTSKPFFVAT